MMMGWGVSDQQQQGKWKKGPWTAEEDMLLTQYVSLHGEGRWSSVAMSAGLNRSGKSCRLRWVNYLRPGLKRGHLTPLEQAIIIELHALWGNKWSTIARYLPGRTDNEIKNYWRTHFKKKGNPFQNQSKKKLVKLQNQQEENGTRSSGKVISPDQPQSDVTCDQNLSAHHGQHSMPSTYTNMENPHVPVWYREVDSWSTDTIPMDGLWNFDDQNDKGEQANDGYSKMANQNRATFDPWI